LETTETLEPQVPQTKPELKSVPEHELELEPAPELDPDLDSQTDGRFDESDGVEEVSSESESDDGEGEWITPSNVALHKSRALSLIPDATPTAAEDQPLISVGCMTADFAMQNVIMQMGLDLVGVEGKRISSVKNWILRCHACFKWVFSFA
jgi:RNA-binding protein NOB1